MNKEIEMKELEWIKKCKSFITKDALKEFNLKESIVYKYLNQKEE
jgi:ACT domain-containing protein